MSGDREEARRDVYAELPQELRDKLQIAREQVLKLETAVYGLRSAPRARWKRVVRDLTETGWVQHQLDLPSCSCVILSLLDSSKSTRTIPWWLDVASIPFSQLLCRNSKEHLFQWRTWNDDNFTCTFIEIETLPDGGYHLRRQKFVDQLELMSLGQRRSRADTDKLTPGESTQRRGVSGSANWLGNQTRPDLCASTCTFQGAHASATAADTPEASKFDCVDSIHTCQFEFPRFLWTI